MLGSLPPPSANAWGLPVPEAPARSKVNTSGCVPSPCHGGVPVINCLDAFSQGVTARCP